MKIVVSNMYFTTHNGLWSTRVFDICKEWVSLGHDVHVITAKYYKSDLLHYEAGLSIIEGINVHIVDVEINNTHGFLKRILSFLIFSLKSIISDLRIKADAYVYSSGPINVIVNGLISKFLLKRRNVYFEIRDLWPEGIEELGLIKNKRIISLLKSIVSHAYKVSKGIIVLSEGMKDYILKEYQIEESKILVATNFADFEFIRTNENEKVNFEIPEKYFLYYGNFGDINMVTELASFFYKNRNQLKTDILFVGGGQRLNELLKYKKKSKNIHVYSSIEKNCLIPVIKGALASFVSLKKGLILDTSSPNKLFESLGCGVPVIQTSNGWIKHLVENNDLGLTINLNENEKSIKIFNDFEENNFNYLTIKDYAFKNFNKKKYQLKSSNF